MSKINESIIDKYLEQLEKTRGEDLSVDEIKQVFLDVVTDYKQDKLFLEEMSGICNYLWSQAQGKVETDQELSNYANMLLYGAEINYYLSNVEENEESGNIAMMHLRDILKYHTKNIK